MRKKLLFFFTLFVISNAQSQSYLDVIRSSSYYASAIVNYSNANYRNALENLSFAEHNLKGKTNRDLEFLKIMSHYNLQEYKEAYNLIKVYFKDGFSDRKKAFRNVNTYKSIHNIDYEEELTTLFVDIENKSNSKQKINKIDLIKSIVLKIESNKKSINNYLNNALLGKVTEKIDYCLRETSNGALKRIYENNYLNLIKQTSSKKQSIYYTGVISGKAIQTSNYKFEVTFSPINPSLTFDAYHYGFKQNSVKHINGNIVLNKTAYQCYSLTAPKHKDSYFSNIIKSKTKAKSFFKSGKKQNEYSVQFTSSENLFLKKDNNLNRLTIALKAKGLL